MKDSPQPLQREENVFPCPARIRLAPTASDPATGLERVFALEQALRDCDALAQAWLVDPPLGAALRAFVISEYALDGEDEPTEEQRDSYREGRVVDVPSEAGESVALPQLLSAAWAGFGLLQHFLKEDGGIHTHSAVFGDFARVVLDVDGAPCIDVVLTEPNWSESSVVDTEPEALVGAVDRDALANSVDQGEGGAS
jgi:hypothetical protein